MLASNYKTTIIVCVTRKRNLVHFQAGKNTICYNQYTQVKAVYFHPAIIFQKKNSLNYFCVRWVDSKESIVFTTVSTTTYNTVSKIIQIL